MESYPVSNVRILMGRETARAKFLLQMARKYNVTITHLDPLICPCHGCAMRRKWQLVTKSVGYVAKQRGYGMSAEFGKADAKLQDGRVMVSFRVTDPRRVSKPKNGTQS